MAALEAYGMKLIAHDLLDGWGGIGEGMSIQKTRDGRRIMWLAHEGPPKNFTGVDVTDPRHPKVVVQTELPHMKVRSNSLEVCGDIMAVAYQTLEHGLQPAGFELFDVSVPENPRSISFFDCSGPLSRGVHQVWFVDGRYVHFAGGAADFMPHNGLDDQAYRIVDVGNPSKPVEVGRWWMPGTRQGDKEPQPTRLPIDSGFRAHNTNVFPQRPDRAYVAYLDGGGRQESKLLSRNGALAYAAESMRLTTRLMQVASWLLVQRAVREGDMQADAACDERYRLSAEAVCLSGAPEEPLPMGLLDLLDRSARLYDRVRHLDRKMYLEVGEAEAPNAVLSQFDRLRDAFAGAN